MKERCLITGITGFAGSYMAEFLLEQGNVEVYGIRRWRSRMENIEHIEDKITLIECDLRDLSSVTNCIEEVRPDKIFHLAAQSFVPTSWVAPNETLTTNILGALNIFEAIRKSSLLDTKIQIAGSSEEYGMVYADEVPIKETNPLRPLSPYGVSKVAHDVLGYQYYMSYKLNIVRTRGFNHSGPRRGDVFVEANFAKQIAEIEKGLKEPVIYVGNLEAERDYTDVRDMVKAYWLSLEKADMGEVYNICSGKSYKIKEVLDILLSMSKIKVEIKQDPSRMRPSDVLILLGDHTKFSEKTGWQPTIPFEKTLADILDYWRNHYGVK
ncbi:MAG: GDP-mannose 4,6-dehydratase [bacterium]|nr:GDP-mannose 4,6-dehydratase [bacterium]